MTVITKENIIEYLKSRLPDLDDSTPAVISMVGEGTPEEDGDGYVNYIFRVRTGNYALVLKQSLPYGRMTQYPMVVERNSLEYDCMKIFGAIMPECVPHLYFIDEANSLFVMEDVSDFSIARFSLNRNMTFEKMGELAGTFMARTAFYTSEYYLPREKFRNLQMRFDNTRMRRIMEDGIFVDRFKADTDETLGPEFKDFADGLCRNERYETERFKLRRSYMSHADALIHADFHTSNMLVDDSHLKVIDYEFAFMGPFGYDLGYLTGNLISQYCAACFRPFPDEKTRKSFKAYLLSSIKVLFESYRSTLISCWQESAKEVYRDKKGLLRDILREIMLEAPGYASVVNWFRATTSIEYPDFETIEDLDEKRRAIVLSLLIDWEIMFARYSWNSVDEMIRLILGVEQSFMKKIGR